MYNLNLPLSTYQADLQTKDKSGKAYVLDPIRKKYVRLTPEELVRQLLLQYLIQEQQWSKSLLAVEKTVHLGKRIKRFDLLIYTDATHPHILVECKSPKEPIRQRHFDQIMQYNIQLKAPYLWISNGSENYLAKIDLDNKQLIFKKEFVSS